MSACYSQFELFSDVSTQGPQMRGQDKCLRSLASGDPVFWVLGYITAQQPFPKKVSLSWNLTNAGTA